MNPRTFIALVPCLLSLASAGFVFADPPEPAAAAIDIPRLDGITIDGDAADWQDRGFHVDVLPRISGPARPASAFDPTVRLGWNDLGVLVLVTVRDATPNEQDGDDNWYTKDSVELFVAGKLGAAAFTQLVLSPGVDARHPDLRSRVYPLGVSAPENAKPTVQAMAASHKTSDGYVIEALLPWSMFTGGDRPLALGDEIAGNVIVNDADAKNVLTRAAWYPDEGTSKDSHLLYRMRLANAAGPPQRLAAAGIYERFRRVALNVMTRTPSDGTATVEVRDGNRLIATAVMPPGEGLREAALELPMPAPGSRYGPLAITVDGQAGAPLLLPDPNPARRSALGEAAFGAKPFVFSGGTLPKCDFREPNYVEDVAGRYTVQTTYYDAAGNAVTSAPKAGRYGAVCTIATQAGWTTTRSLTLFRTNGTVNWGQPQAFSAVFPAELGLDPAVVREHPRVVADTLKNDFTDSFTASQGSARTMAGLSEMVPGEPDVLQNLPGPRDEKWWYSLQKKLGRGLYPHRVYVPDAYAADPARRWPLMLWLHGSGERGEDLSVIDRYTVARRLQEQKDDRFIVVSPQCPSGERWNSDAVMDLLNDIKGRYRIDPDRVYLTGLSMGGMGTWNTATLHPDEFAAIAPVCGYGDPDYIKPLADLPCWAFHGEVDPTVPYARDAATVEALKKAGGRVRFTVYPGVGHNCWDLAYSTRELYDWLLRQSRGKPDEAKPDTP